MAKFGKGKKELPAISTASLPDIVFMLLFFFMVVTKMKDVTLKIQYRKPGATQSQKLENRTLVSNIYIGAPLDKYKSKYGDQPVIQLDDKIAKVNKVGEYVRSRVEAINEGDRKKHTTSLKIDKEVKMGIVSDVKMALRDAEQLKINYASRRIAAIDKFQ